MGETLPEIAVKLFDTNFSASQKFDTNNSKSLLFMGGKNSGKSTLIYSFLEKRENPKETLTLEYSYGRKNWDKQQTEKSVCHIWEYGGDVSHLAEVLTPLKRSLPRLTVFVVLDLSKTATLWHSLETVIENLKKSFQKDPEQKDEEERPYSMVIVGGKYDVFKNFDPDIKKLVCTTLRAAAIILEASLLFYSSKDANLARILKEALGIYGFGNGILTKEKVTGHNRPLYIPAETDSWQLLDSKQQTLDNLAKDFVRKIPQSVELQLFSDDAAQDPAFHEPLVDSMRAAKFQEIRSHNILDVALD